MLSVSCSAQTNKQSTSYSTVSTVSETVEETKNITAPGTTAAATQHTASPTSSTTKTKNTNAGTTTTVKAETTVKTTAKTTTASKSTTSSAVTCTVTIECKKILEHMDDLKKGHENFVPDDGIILSTYTVTLENGQSAYDALKKACSDNNIKITESSSKYGAYIIGFNNIDEKDCGNGSGWLYFVNDSTLNLSSKKYIVKNNDRIVFSYTV